jgi:voltage-gated potassium channel Kch
MVKSLIISSKDKDFQVLFMFTVITLFSGTMFYSQVEGLRKLDALYFSVMTLTTVGYGDFVPQTDFGKIFTILYTLVGIGLILGFINKVAANIRPSKIISKQWNKQEKENG